MRVRRFIAATVGAVALLVGVSVAPANAAWTYGQYTGSGTCVIDGYKDVVVKVYLEADSLKDYRRFTTKLAVKRGDVLSGHLSPTLSSALIDVFDDVTNTNSGYTAVPLNLTPGSDWTVKNRNAAASTSRGVIYPNRVRARVNLYMGNSQVCSVNVYGNTSDV